MALLDARGQPVDLAALRGEVAGPTGAFGLRRPWTESIASGLTPARLSACLRSADEGEQDDFLTLAEELEEREPHYRSVLQTRKLAVIGLLPQVQAAGGGELEQEQAAVVDELVHEAGFAPLLLDLLDALAKGYSVVELNWRTDAAAPAPWRPCYAWRDPRWFCWDAATLSHLVLRGSAVPRGTPLPPYKFIVHTPQLKTGLPVRGGLARVAVWAYLFKAYALKDWAAFLEVFGMPLRIGRYGAGATAKDIATLRQAVINLGSDAAAVLHESMQIEFQDAVQGRGGEQVFLAAAEFWDKQTSKAVLGQTASTEGTPGRLGSDQAQLQVRADLLRADARALAATLNRELVRPFIDLNWGPPPGERYPRITLPLPLPDTTASLVNAVARLAPLGLRVDQRALRETLGLPEPAVDAELLGAPLLPPRQEAGKPAERAAHSPAAQG